MRGGRGCVDLVCEVLGRGAIVGDGLSKVIGEVLPYSVGADRALLFLVCNDLIVCLDRLVCVRNELVEIADHVCDDVEL